MDNQKGRPRRIARVWSKSQGREARPPARPHPKPSYAVFSRFYIPHIQFVYPDRRVTGETSSRKKVTDLPGPANVQYNTLKYNAIHTGKGVKDRPTIRYPPAEKLNMADASRSYFPGFQQRESIPISNRPALSTLYSLFLSPSTASLIIPDVHVACTCGYGVLSATLELHKPDNYYIPTPLPANTATDY